MERLTLIAFLLIVFFIGCVDSNENGTFSNVSNQNLTEENISAIDNQSISGECSDGTLNGQCTANYTHYCKNGSLVVDIGICGYPGDISQCDQYKTEPKTISYTYYTGQIGRAHV